MIAIRMENWLGGFLLLLKCVSILAPDPLQTRLVSGSVPSEGRVEVYYRGSWGTVCDDSWDINDAQVVCRSIGYTLATASHSSAHFGQGTGNIVLDDVACTGSETNLAYCGHSGYLNDNCGHGEDAGVTCQFAPLQTRLVRGSVPSEGRVEVYYRGSWGTVCDDLWGLNDANVVCRSIGYTGATAYHSSAHFGQGTGNIVLDNVACTGSETNLAYCGHNGYLIENCGHGEDAGVTCSNLVPLQTRMIGGSVPYEGRVEVYYQGAWGTVCDDGWDINDANVVCQSMGYISATAFHYSAHFGQGTGNIVLDNVACTGSETNLAFCTHNGYHIENCGHGEDAGVTCSGENALLTTRLTGGSRPNEGRVEVYYQDAWGTVCDDSWDLNAAHVVCRSIGYMQASAYHGSAHFGQGSGNIVLDDVVCKGSESNLAFCQHAGFLVHNCGHDGDAGVTCDGIGLETRLAGGRGPFEGRVEVFYQGAWGTICDDDWDLVDAHVVCRTFGYPQALSYHRSAYFGEGTGEIILDDVDCSGTESNIALCRHSGYSSSSCGHSEDAGVTCSVIEAVRLVDGVSPNEGRVEVNYQGSWGTICDDSWDINDATVICRMLGYPGKSSVLEPFGQETGNITIGGVRCNGTEMSISQCGHNGYGVHNCSHSMDVGVRCGGEVELSLRLTGGRRENEGRVEVLYMGEWGNVCQYGWSITDSDVVCRSLGFLGANETSLSFGGGPGNVILRKPECSGKESSLLECQGFRFGFSYCGHTEALGISCLEHDEIQVRLVGGNSDKEGRVEANFNGTWGTVCDDNWDLEDANVVCRMLGFERAESYTCCAGYGEGSGPIFLNEVQCDGTESNIGNCSRSDYKVNDCDHSEDAGVSCIEYGSDIDECNDTLEDYPCDTSNGVCSNTNGSYVCSCTDGYILGINNTCKELSLRSSGRGGLIGGLVSSVVVISIIVVIGLLWKYRKFPQIPRRNEPKEIDGKTSAPNPNSYGGRTYYEHGNVHVDTAGNAKLKGKATYHADKCSDNDESEDIYENLGD